MRFQWNEEKDLCAELKFFAACPNWMCRWPAYDGMPAFRLSPFALSNSAPGNGMTQHFVVTLLDRFAFDKTAGDAVAADADMARMDVSDGHG
jgi:hypothetical protein